MSPPTFEEFARRGYNRIPVMREVFADLDTPLSVYLKLADGPYSYLLESAQVGGEKWARYSIIGLPAETVLKVRRDKITVEQHGEVIETVSHDDPLRFIEEFQGRFRVADHPELPRFCGGLVGYFGYDVVRYTEKRIRESAPPEVIDTPDVLLMFSNDVVVFDNVRGTMQLVTLADPSEPEAEARAQQRLEALEALLDTAIDARHAETGAVIEEEDFVSAFGREPFFGAVERIKEYILDGDVMQVVLAQLMTTEFSQPPIFLYRALRSISPAPYMYFMDLDDFHIVSSSPEILARVEDGVITVRPLAGTRRRGRTEEDDVEMERELLADPKEIAEHLMLIDLSRNDSGRVSTTGTVRVTDAMFVERYSHVMHIASNVESELKEGCSAMDVLRATLPVGTLSGAPKVRAMEIIDELERRGAGIYGGAVGYLSWNGNMDTAIAIRTAVVKDGTLYLETGAGVVADSIPELEWKECLNKARAIFQAAALAESGLRGGERT